MDTKICLSCKITKNTDSFCSHKRKKDGLNSYCKDCAKKQLQEYKLKNPKRFNDIQVKYQNSDKGKETRKKYVPTKSKEYVIWYRAKENSIKRVLDFNLDVEDIIIPQYYPLLGMELKYDIKDCNEDDYYSIDRIDSSLGYVKGNIQIISNLANTMKNKSTKEQLITFAKNILEIYKDDL